MQGLRLVYKTTEPEERENIVCKQHLTGKKTGSAPKKLRKLKKPNEKEGWVSSRTAGTVRPTELNK